LGEPGPTALATTSDGSRVAYSDSVNGQIKVYDVVDGVFVPAGEVELADSETDVYTLAFSPDGQMLAFGGTDFYANIWDISSGDQQILDDSLTGFEGAVQSLTFTPDGTELLGSGTSSGGIGRWQVSNGPVQADHDLIPATGSTMSIDLSTDGELLAAGNDDGTVSLWQIAPMGADESTMLWSMQDDPASSALSVSLTSDGSLMAVGYRSGTVKVWDITGTEPVEIPLADPMFGSWAMSVQFSPDDDLLAAGSSDGIARTWDTDEWQTRGVDLQHPTAVTNVRFADNQTLLTAVADGSLRTWDLDHPQMVPFGASIWSTEFSRDGSRLLAMSRERGVLWDTSGDKPTMSTDSIRPPDPDNVFSGEGSLSPDGGLGAFGTAAGPVVVVAIDDDGEVETIDTLTELDSLVEAIAFDPDGGLLAGLGTAGTMQLWAVEGTGSTASVTDVASIDLPGGARNLTFSPDGSTLAVATDDSQVTIYDLADSANPEIVHQLSTGESMATGVSFHPDGEVLAVSNADSTVSLWELGDEMELLTRISGPTGRVHDVDFTPDGQRLAASTSENAAWIWDVDDLTSPVLLAVVPSAGQDLYSLSYSPDGNLLVGGGAYGRVFVWQPDEEAAVGQLCGATVGGHSITTTEWEGLSIGRSYQQPCR